MLFRRKTCECDFRNKKKWDVYGKIGDFTQKNAIFRKKHDFQKKIFLSRKKKT